MAHMRGAGRLQCGPSLQQQALVSTRAHMHCTGGKQRLTLEAVALCRLAAQGVQLRRVRHALRPAGAAISEALMATIWISIAIICILIGQAPLPALASASLGQPLAWHSAACSCSPLLSLALCPLCVLPLLCSALQSAESPAAQLYARAGCRLRRARAGQPAGGGRTVGGLCPSPDHPAQAQPLQTVLTCLTT